MRVRTRSFVALLSLTMALVGCAQDVEVKLQSVELRDALLVELRERDIAARKSKSPAAIVVDESDYARTIEVLEEVAAAYLPLGRSTHFENAEVQMEFLSLMRANNVEYQIREHQGEKWIVWAEEDTDIVSRLLEIHRDKTGNGE